MMNFRQRLAGVAPKLETVLTIGVFDGVHLGHRHLLERLTQLADDQYQPAVITFTNHPVTVLRPDFQVRYITTPDQKMQLLQQLGIDLVVPLEFTPELARVTAREFATMMVEFLRLKGLVLGPDFVLGHNREGNAAVLRQLGEEMGFWVETVEPLVQDGELVRSRRIREAIGSGDFAAVGRLLGRQFSLTGTVVTGNRRGRELGFPTANLAVAPEMMLPGDGIYATWAIIGGVRHASATSVGVRPTFGLTERVVEVYVLDFDADLYGQEISVEFVRKLRDQEAFPDVPALVARVNQDVAEARAALVTNGGTAVG